MRVRSCEQSVIHCRVISCFARVIAIENPAQYFVLRTSVSWPFQRQWPAGSRRPCSVVAKPSVSLPPFSSSLRCP
jgi:hypothetical protein